MKGRCSRERHGASPRCRRGACLRRSPTVSTSSQVVSVYPPASLEVMRTREGATRVVVICAAAGIGRLTPPPARRGRRRPGAAGCRRVGWGGAPWIARRTSVGRQAASRTQASCAAEPSSQSAARSRQASAQRRSQRVAASTASAPTTANACGSSASATPSRRRARRPRRRSATKRHGGLGAAAVAAAVVASIASALRRGRRGGGVDCGRDGHGGAPSPRAHAARGVVGLPRAGRVGMSVVAHADASTAALWRRGRGGRTADARDRGRRRAAGSGRRPGAGDV